MKTSIERYVVIVFTMVVVIAFFSRVLDFTRLTVKPPSEPIKAMIGGTSFDLDVADSEEERAWGLSGKLNLSSGQGMLFVFDSSNYHGIWMKDMNFPVDIFWLDENYCIVDSKINISPETFPKVFKPSLPARYVVELPAQSFTGEFYCIKIE